MQGVAGSPLIGTGLRGETAAPSSLVGSTTCGTYSALSGAVENVRWRCRQSRSSEEQTYEMFPAGGYLRF